MHASSAQCHICKRGPFLLCNLYSHLRGIHFCKEDEIREVREAIKRAKYRVLDQIICDICGKIYYSSSGLRKHRRKAHNEGSVIPSNPSETDHLRNIVFCPGCEETFSSNMELAAHCDSDHNYGFSDFTILKARFSGWRSFESWKTSKERETFTKLVRRTSRRSSKGTTHMYACQYSGRSTAKTDLQRKREKKVKRISKHCPCFAKVTQRLDEAVDVLACFGHFGHEINSAELPLSRDDELVVKSMIMSGIPFKKIVSQLRVTRWNVEAPQEKQPRLCYLTNRDVLNIATRHGLLRSENCDRNRSLDCSLEEQHDISLKRLHKYENMSDEEVTVDT